MQDREPYHLNIERCLSEGWDYFKRRPFMIIGTILMLYGLMFAFMFAFMGISLAFGRATPTSPFAGLFMNAVFILVFAPFIGGVHKFILNASRDTAPVPTDVFSGFKRYGTILGTYLLWIAIVIICMAPTWLYILYFTISAVAPGYAATMSNAVTTPALPPGFWILPLVMIVNLLLVMGFLARFAMVYFIIMDDPNIGVIAAFRRSAAISKGNNWRLIGLYIICSFIAIGLTILLIIPVLTVGMFLILVYGRAYINLKEGYDKTVPVPEPVTPVI